jgi:hypothetical protein
MFLNRATSQKQWQAESQYVPPSAQPTFVRWRAFSPIGIIMFHMSILKKCMNS